MTISSSVKKSIDRSALRLFRLAARKQQLALGREIGRSQTWISKVERGNPTYVVTETDLENLAKALGCQTADLER